MNDKQVLKIDSKFLDHHCMGELEEKIWKWIESQDCWCSQGLMEEEGYGIEIRLYKEEKK